LPVLLEAADDHARTGVEHLPAESRDRGAVVLLDLEIAARRGALLRIVDDGVLRPLHGDLPALVALLHRELRLVEILLLG